MRAERADSMVTDQLSGTRDKIQAVALELFASQGFERTSLREIADRLGLTKAALYYHFPAKTELIRSLVQPALVDVEKVLDEAEAAGDVSPRTLLTDFFDAVHRHRGVYLALLQDMSSLASLDLMTSVLRWRERLQALVVGPDPSVEQRVRAVVALGGLQDCAVLLTDLSTEELRSAAVTSACDALGLG